MLKTFKGAVLVIILIVLNTAYAQNNLSEINLMPYPQKLELLQSRLSLNEDFSVSVKGTYCDRINKYTSRFLGRLAGRTGLFFKNNEVLGDPSSPNTTLTINAGREGRLEENEDESYQLEITDKGITITSATDLGSMHALETLLQMLSAGKDGYYFPSVKIQDAPRFTWRGLMFDAGRHFMPMDVLKRNLNAMAAVKMNVMHWHLTEDQGFRIECRTFPELHRLGSDGQYYTQEEIKEIIAYAKDRGIRVIPEFDIPGHSTSWFISHPEFASADETYKIERKWGIFNPTFDPTKEEVYQFFDKFFAEMAGLFPDSYIHIGGDENNGKQWSSNPAIKKFMADNNIPDNHALQGYFNQRILKILSKYNKKMIGWDNILREDMPKNILLQSWQGVESLARSAKLGYRSILSSDYYIDLVQPTTLHYLNDPIPVNTKLTVQEQGLILGGEATMWSEFVNTETVDSRIWPRTAAIAERLWSPQSVSDVDDMYKRLDYISFQLEELGLTHEKNMPMMLRRLTNNSDITALKNFVDLVEPVKLYTRNEQREHSSFSPLTRVVDAARPDQKIPRQFSHLVDTYLSKRSDKDSSAIMNFLSLWSNNHKELSLIIDKSPVLREIESLSFDLSQVAQIGVDLLKFQSAKQQPGSQWFSEKLSVLEKAKLPRGQVELMIVQPVEKLLRSMMNKEI